MSLNLNRSQRNHNILNFSLILVYEIAIFLYDFPLVAEFFTIAIHLTSQS